MSVLTTSILVSVFILEVLKLHKRVIENMGLNGQMNMTFQYLLQILLSKMSMVMKLD